MLYAVSNIGSFLGLLSYPFLFERYFDLDTQVTIWRILYLVFLLLYLIALMTIDFRGQDRRRLQNFRQVPLCADLPLDR